VKKRCFFKRFSAGMIFLFLPLQLLFVILFLPMFFIAKSKNYSLVLKLIGTVPFYYL